MVISRIFKKGKNAVIEFDSGDSILVSIEIVLKSGLRKNDSMNDELLNQIQNEDTLFKMKNSAFRILSGRLHTKKELADKLIKKQYPIECVKKILNELEEKGYIDDLLFTRKYIEEKSLKKGESFQKVKFDLIRKGIDRKVAENELKSIYTQEILVENAKRIVAKKTHQLQNELLTATQLKQKIFLTLQLKGYEINVIKQALEEVKNTTH